MLIRPPATESEFEAYYALRWKILREPWNQPPGSEKDEFEGEAIHLAAWDEAGRLIGVGRLHRVVENCGQIRYMAVDPAQRSHGVGKAILRELEVARSESGIRGNQAEFPPGRGAVLREKRLSGSKTFAHPLWRDPAFRNVEAIALNAKQVARSFAYPRLEWHTVSWETACSTVRKSSEAVRLERSGHDEYSVHYSVYTRPRDDLSA